MGYDDGYVCVRNTEKKTLVRTVSIMNENPDNELFRCKHWREPKLVVCTARREVKIWQYFSSSFTQLGSGKEM